MLGSDSSASCLPLISNVTTHELIRVLAYPKFRLSAPDQEGLLSDYLPWCSAVQIPLDQSLLRSSAIHTISVIRDPHDLAFLELALAGKADYLVSGDADLHAVAGQFPIPIITAEAFLGLLVSSAG